MNPEIPASVESPETPPPSRFPVWGWTDVALFFGLGLPVIFFVQFGLGLIARAFHHSPTGGVVQLTGQAVAYVLLYSVLAMILRVQYDAPFWRSIGWVPSRIPAGLCVVLGFTIAISVSVLGGVLHIPEVESPITKLIASPHGLLLVGIFGIFVAPLAEEIAFRGFLQPLLVRSLGVVAGIAITAALFGMLHWEQNARSWAHVALITVAGVAFGVLRHLSGSIRASTWAHIAYNGFFFLAIFASGRKYSI